VGLRGRTYKLPLNTSFPNTLSPAYISLPRPRPTHSRADDESGADDHDLPALPDELFSGVPTPGTRDGDDDGDDGQDGTSAGAAASGAPAGGGEGGEGADPLDPSAQDTVGSVTGGGGAGREGERREEKKVTRCGACPLRGGPMLNSPYATTGVPAVSPPAPAALSEAIDGELAAALEDGRHRGMGAG